MQARALSSNSIVNPAGCVTNRFWPRPDALSVNPTAVIFRHGESNWRLACITGKALLASERLTVAAVIRARSRTRIVMMKKIDSAADKKIKVATS